MVLSYTTLGVEANDPVLLMHGFTLTHSTWDHVSSRLLARNRRVILPDLPGHGASAGLGAMSIEATSDSLSRLLEECGVRQVSVVGYSLGGRMALDFACRYPDKVSCLVLEGASPGIEDPEGRERRRLEDASLAREIERRGIYWFVDYWEGLPLFATQRTLPPEAIAAIRRDRLSNTAAGLASSLRAAGAGSMTPLWDEMNDLPFPVLIVAGRLDRKYLETGVAMKERIRRATLLDVEGAGHCVHVERPEEFSGLLERFLDANTMSLRPKRNRSR
jgi:2-succinyl-6-hydroxy-2,4-cyclohexadiene-1-carboxylate synthase